MLPTQWKKMFTLAGLITDLNEHSLGNLKKLTGIFKSLLLFKPLGQRSRVEGEQQVVLAPVQLLPMR